MKPTQVSFYNVIERLMLPVLLLGFVVSGCATMNRMETEAGLDRAIHNEYRGQEDFWGYHNAAFLFQQKGDRTNACTMFLRAYRNTGVLLIGPRPPGQDKMDAFLFGRTGELIGRNSADDYVAKLDSLTPPPGTGAAANEEIDGEKSYLRSMAAYNWARNAGRLGDFAGAEKALLYALRLEKTRHTRDKYISSRYYELARLYFAWGKPSVSAQYYKDAIAATESLAPLDPIGYATVLDEYAAVLDANGNKTEATKMREQSRNLREKYPNKKAQYHTDPYPESVVVK